MVVMTELRELAAKDLAAALAAANGKPVARARCQALAWVARYGPQDRVAEIARTALAAAQEADDPYHSLSASAWPLRALIERGHAQAADAAVGPLLVQSELVQPMASRSEGLFLVFQAIVAGEGSLWRTVLEVLIAASTPPRYWRQGRNIRDAVLIVAGRDAALASHTAARLEDAKLRGRLQRKLAAGVSAEPRTFFW